MLLFIFRQGVYIFTDRSGKNALNFGEQRVKGRIQELQSFSLCDIFAAFFNMIPIMYGPLLEKRKLRFMSVHMDLVNINVVS